MSTMVPPVQPRRAAATSRLSKLTYAQSLTGDNDTQRITAHLDANKSATEIGEEAYRLCHVNAIR